jgi:hypothetical protein
MKTGCPMSAKFRWLPLLCIGLLACKPENPGKPLPTRPRALAADGDHMVSINAADAPPPPAPPCSRRTAVAAGAAGEWPRLGQLRAPTMPASRRWRRAGRRCSASITQALEPCAERGLMRVRYAGKINPGFAEMMWRLAVVADAMKIHKRILDLDSSGGQVEAAIVAGDSIGESGWTIWVREGSICHSACVFVLAAGDNRLMSGKVGIHRMMRISSRPPRAPSSTASCTRSTTT